MYDVNEVRKCFPLLRNQPIVFLDNCATTLKPDPVIAAVNNYYTNLSANAHRGDYDMCYAVEQELAETRTDIAVFLNAAGPQEIIYTGGATAGLNLVAFGYGRKFLQKDDVILTTEAEHASGLLPWMKVAQETGACLKYIPLDAKGQFQLSEFEAMMDSRVKVVAAAQITNVLGYILPMKEICAIAHRYGAVVVVDGAQSVPHLPVDVADMDCDFLAFSAHKMCGPTGIGVLYGKLELLKRMAPLHWGGGSNAGYDRSGNIGLNQPPHKFESGTLPLEGIFGLHAAVRFLRELGMEEIHRHEVKLQEYMVQRLAQMDHIRLYNPHNQTGIITFNVKNVFAQDAAAFFNQHHIAVRTGQHCSKLLEERLGICSTIRCSVYLYTSMSDVEQFMEACSQATKENCLKLFYP